VPEPKEYKVTLRDVAVRDFEALDPGVRKQALKQFEKLKRSPQLGKELGHKMGVNLTGYRALRFYKGKYRIVYRILEEEKEVEIWGIGEREAGRIYRMVGERILFSRRDDDEH